MITISKIAEKLRDHEYRKAFVAAQINVGIPSQLRALLKSRGWTQEQLAERAQMLQPRISDMMKTGKTRPNIETLRRLAGAFDCGLIVRFAPFSELARWSEDFDPEAFNVPDFDHDPGLVDRIPPAMEKSAAMMMQATGTDAASASRRIVLEFPVASSQSEQTETTAETTPALTQDAAVASWQQDEVA